MKEGLYNTNGGKQQGWEVQNQGQVRRLPGEGPAVNGGREQSQEMDSFDQPQYSVREMFGDEEVDEGVEGMKRSVKDMKHAVSKLKKSSEKEQEEHPWASKKIATKIAKDHMEKEGLVRAFIIKESPEVLKPGDWYEAVQFHQLDGVSANDPQLRGLGHKTRPNSKPMKGYVVYEVLPDGSLKARAANWDSGD